MTAPIVALALVALALLAGSISSVRVLGEYERGVVLRLGRLRPLYGPGMRRVVPGLERLVRVDLRVVTLTIPPQEVITRDNVPARVNAVVLFRVVDPIRSVMEVENFAVATSQIAQTTLRSLLGREDLDNLLAHREDLNDRLRRQIAEQTTPWGVEVRIVEIKDVEIPEAMQRAMAREAEAERERRAKIINARGELQASDELRQAADTLSRSPASLQLRYLQTLLELGADHNSTDVHRQRKDDGVIDTSRARACQRVQQRADCRAPAPDLGVQLAERVRSLQELFRWGARKRSNTLSELDALCYCSMGRPFSKKPVRTQERLPGRGREG